MKHFIPLENNPVVLTPLAHTLGLSPTLAFHDLYSLTDPTLLALIPRPAHALLAIIPSAPAWLTFRAAEEANAAPYALSGAGAAERVLWFKQIIGNACGLIGLLHCALNGQVAAESLEPAGALAQLRKEAAPLGVQARAELLESSDLLEQAHGEAAERGDTAAPSRYVEPGFHFVAFVKGDDGHLYEMEGDRLGPVDRGLMEEGEDMLSERVIAMGLGRAVEVVREAGGVLTFSCTVLAPSE